MLHAQQPKLIKVSEFGVSHIKTIEERVFLVHSIMEKGYYCFSNADVPGTIEVYMANDASDELSDFDFFFDNVLYEQLNEFSHLDKNERGELFVQWRQDIDDEVFRTLYEDFTRGLRTENATCETALPFCTNMGLYVFPAGVNSGSPCGDTYNAQCSEPYKCTGAHQGQDNCLSTAPNPAFYYMRIDEPGNLNIYMYTTPPEDLDFDCWGPFEDMNTACDLLSCSNMVDCSYSADPTEHCHINGALTGQYYILLITNYSNSPCNISFENVGTGTTDCSILPPLVSGGGPYCVGETIHLTAQNQPGATFSWTGPNGFSSTEQNPSIPSCTMEMAGIYTCTITIGDESSSAETEFVEVDAMPSADFTFTSACEGDPIQFTSTSTTNPTGQTITNFEWDFGDDQTASGQSVSHAFDHYGDYEVTLTVSTGQGVCTDQKTMTVTVYAIPQLNVTASPSSVIYGGIATLTAIVETPGNFTYHWEPANMVTNPNSQTTQTVPITSPQVFTVTVTNELGGCSSSTPVTVSMAGSDLTATATADQYEICENGSTTLHALPMAGTGNYTYSWSPANLLNSTTSQNPVATPPVGTTTFTCIVSDGMTEQEISVTILVRAHEESDRYESICENGSYDFFGQILTETGVYSHTLQNQFGCDSIVHLHLSFNALDSIEFTVSDAENCNFYFWNPQGHVYTTSDAIDPEDHIYTESGEYHRIYSNHLGCDSLVTMKVHFDYTPTPTEIYPMDLENTAPHWVVTATEFQINSYDFHLWDTNEYCYWDSVTWNFAEPNQWVLEPFGDRNTCCKMYVLEQIEDTVWLEARAFNRCAPQGIVQRYWFVCSFYGIEEDGPSTGLGTSNFEVIPNPNNGQMQLRFEYLSGKANIKVYDSRGMLIDSFETYHSDGQFTYPYDMKTTANGIYFFVVTNKEGTVAKKVVIQR
jgi:hypothetical protein